MERNDIHRPSVIEPKEYQFVCFDYVGPRINFEQCSYIKEQRAIFAQRECYNQLSKKYFNFDVPIFASKNEQEVK